MQNAAVRCSLNWRFHDGFRGEEKGPPLDLKFAAVAVVVSTAPYDPYKTGAAWMARNVGAQVIGITDAPESPVGFLARDVLIVHVRQRGLFKSYVAAMALAEMLVLMAAGRMGCPGGARCQRESDWGCVFRIKWFVLRGGMR